MSVTYVGRKASKCRKCSSDKYFVNKLGGIQCETCSPPRKESDVCMRLRIEGGLWQDSSVERFDMIEVASDSEAIQSSLETRSQSVRTDAATKQAPTPKVPQRNAGPNKQALNDFVVAYGSRGVNGELSAREIDVFSSDVIWDQSDQFIVLKSRSKSSGTATNDVGSNVESPPSQHTSKCQCATCWIPPRLIPIPDGNRKPIPAIGTEIQIKFRIKTFGGMIPPGPAVVCGAGYDGLGNVVVNLGRGGQVVASGVMFERFEGSRE